LKPSDREDLLYKDGKRSIIDDEEKTLLYFLEMYSNKKCDILDVGCGTGDISLELEKRGHKTTGVDFSLEAIKKASNAGLNCRRVDLDEGIPFEDSSFDVVWAGDVIEHVFDPVFVLKEISRTLKPQGLFLATIPYDLYLGVRLRILFGISYQDSTYRNRGQYKHHTFFSKKLMKFMFKSASFEIREIYLKCRLPFTQKHFIIPNTRFLLFGKTMIVCANVRK